MIGGVAGAASVFGNTPVDVIKTRMQVDIYTSIVLSQSLGNAPQTNGICLKQTFVFGLYRTELDFKPLVKV